MAEKRRRAVALKYDHTGKAAAPKVLAKGQGGIADRILEVAREKGIPLYEDPELVEVLGQLDVNTEIQPELYQAVAEVLIFIYKMNQKKKGGQIPRRTQQLGRATLRSK